ncbi:MAG: AbrB/MazE/SpoVT family DNA-binding domain-containing protein [Legionella sp.]|nr:AbrB/MazE/SpoVT family DNA-binding domain-containing protein [Legionella sp.]
MPSSNRRSSLDALPTKSAKIRALAAQGVSRADIARKLDIRYQHVRNVLEHDRAKEAKAADANSSKPEWGDNAVSLKTRLGPDGRVVIPAAFRENLGLKDGDVLFARLEKGEIVLLTPKAAMLRAQAIVRRFVPEGVSLVDELIEDRRREAEREANDD